MAPVATIPRPVPLGAGDPLNATSRALRPTRPSKQVLMEHLRRSGGDVALAARAMGRQRTLVWRWLRQQGVDPQQYRINDAEETEVQCDPVPDQPRAPEPTGPPPSVKGRYSGEA